MNLRATLAIVVCLTAVAVLIAAEAPPAEQKTETTASGLKITKVAPGEGVAKKGDTVWVHYTGKLTDGTKFDSSVDRGQPFKFVVGKGQVIRGWDEGIVQLKKG